MPSSVPDKHLAIFVLIHASEISSYSLAVKYSRARFVMMVWPGPDSIGQSHASSHVAIRCPHLVGQHNMRTWVKAPPS